MSQSKLWLLGGLGFLAFSVPATAGVEICNQIVRENLFDETAVFKRDDGTSVTKKEFCERVNSGSGGSINVIGYGDGSMNNSEARSVCSSDFASQSSTSVLNTYGRFFSANLRSAYETCVNSMNRNPFILVDPEGTQITWNPGVVGGTDGTQFPHYTMDVGFRWAPADATGSTTSRAWVTFSQPTDFITSSASWGRQSTNPNVPPNPDDPFRTGSAATIPPYEFQTVHTNTITSVGEHYVIITVRKGGFIKFVLPAKTK